MRYRVVLLLWMTCCLFGIGVLRAELSGPNVCTQVERIIYHVASKHELREITVVHKFCCEGYEKSGDSCVRYIGNFCEEECPSGTYGQNCSETCLCEHGSCDDVSGQCECFPGYTGIFCNVSCPQNMYVVYRCNCSNDATCDPVNGMCICGPGYVGPQCEEVCPPGSYGADCAKKCLCQNDADCLHTDGTCVCPPGVKTSASLERMAKIAPRNVNAKMALIARLKQANAFVLQVFLEIFAKIHVHQAFLDRNALPLALASITPAVTLELGSVNAFLVTQDPIAIDSALVCLMD
ncbi:multiple epidermal growth factor-like domains protein 11 [Uloborus diversus]|uniref:multiple epidermal growth factor-like domains protein 11 n=1 Tax=Uloborus diversus TaxID=327109 RepID=UPI00240A8F3A|nr:multiple epidermal growth factor-like domains protein 11 [Uloborus diversus]